jgi:hypothetical protein
MDGSPCLLQGASRADSATGWGSAPDQSAANRVEMLVSDGDVPELGTNGSISWTRGVDFGKVDFFEYHLVTNRPGNNPDNCYRTPLNLDKGAGAYDDDPMFARRSSGGFNSEFAWRGPYLTAPIDPDPWGNRYAANVIFLDPRADSRNNRPDRNGFTQDCVVISAGPDEEIDTAYARDGLTPGDDDIIYTVSGNSR